MNKYIQKVEKLVKKKMSEEDVSKDINKKPVTKGFMSKKETSDDKKKISKDSIELIADQVLYIRRKRMELKDDSTD